MVQGGGNFAYIDGANLHKGVASLGWSLDYQRFRVWLTEKYGVATAYIFIGFMPEHKPLYDFLDHVGFVLIFKEVLFNKNKEPKGNCDADLVLRVVQDFYENNFKRALLVSSDGDYSCLVKFLEEKQRLVAVLSPGLQNKCSILLKRTGCKIAYINDQRKHLERP